MKILQLNAWTGRIKGTLPNFIKKNKFDLICLQEAVWAPDRDMLEHFSVSVDQIKEISGFENESRIANWGIKAFGTEISEGIAILSRDKIIHEKTECVYGTYKIATSSADLRDHSYHVQLVKLANGLNILNYHGYWEPTPQGSETTVTAMKKVANIAKSVKGPLIMCGDLNVIHDSPAMRELDFLTDLTNEYHIDNTLAGLKFDGKVACDHILVNDYINVVDFSISPEIVSDHLALIANINFKHTTEAYDETK